MIILSAAMPVFLPAAAEAQTAREGFWSSLEATGEETGHTEAGLDEPVPIVAGRIVKIFLSFLGVIFLGLMIYGGYLWMTARGNEQDVDKAKRIIQHALVGLIIVMTAYGITALIGTQIAYYVTEPA